MTKILVYGAGPLGSLFAARLQQVGADATPDQIKSAYRREAKRLHPDHSGQGSESFLAVQEAYEVLGGSGV